MLYSIGQNLIRVKINLFFQRRLILNFLWEKENIIIIHEGLKDKENWESIEI